MENLPAGYGKGFDERLIEYLWLFSRLPAGPGHLLDAGSILNFEYLLEHSKLSEKQIFISTLAPEKFCFWRKGVSYIFEDLRALSFRSELFDQIVCISTLEHVGMNNSNYFEKEIGRIENRSEITPSGDRFESYKVVVAEFYRVLKPGGKLFLTVPFGSRRDLTWFQVFDSQMLDSVISSFGRANISEQIFLCDPFGWSLSTREKAKNASYFNTEEAKSGKSNGIAAAEAVACLEFTKHE
jgi:SAM-dependent methyltransferase